MGVVSSCHKSVTIQTPPSDSSAFHADDLPTADKSTPGIGITWDTLGLKISHQVGYAEYPRVHRINGDTLILTYHCGPMTNSSDVFYGDEIAMRLSFDNGGSWSQPDILVPDNNPAYYGYSDPDVLVLHNGWILLVYVGRGDPDDNEHDNVQVILSKDRGATWGPPTVAARGRSWEPGMVQLPDGTIELFYSSEAAWWPGSNPQQEILMIHSGDNGASWSNPWLVAYTDNDRDGMPVPLVLKDNKGIVFSLESVNNSLSPWIAWSSMDANWNYQTYASVQNGRRWPALNVSQWGGAPFLIQLPSGITLLSFQNSGGRNIGGDWKKSTMLVMTGNSVAENFVNLSYPWPGLPTDEGAYFNSLFLKNDSTIMAVTTRSFADNHSEIWWKKGHIH